ncbi:MAG: hypothetical protein JJ919_07425 [Henriciella sp.]|nr:hypothetical protein [Henriciella sp.]
MRAIFVSLGLMIMVPAAALAQTDVSTEMIYECANIDSDAERLTCYDDAVSRFQAAEASGQLAIIDKSDVEQLNRESFGLSLPSIPKNILPKFGKSESADLDEILEPVSQVTRLRFENLRITLENGQVWEQTDGKQIVFSEKRGAETAAIKRAAFGSFKMKLDGGRSFRVKRIK